MAPPASAKADRVAAALLFLFSIFVVVEALALPYWTANAPGPGFVPFWLGALLACASIGVFARTIRSGVADLSAVASTKAGAPPSIADSALTDRATTIRVATIVGLTAAAAALSLVVGLVLASGVFMAATLTYLRPAHARANGAAAVLTPIVVWLLFVRWLAVPLPAGLFGY